MRFGTECTGTRERGLEDVLQQLVKGGVGDGFMRKILDALPVAVYTTDAAGRLTFYNEAAVSLWGYRPELGRSEWCGSWKLFWPDGRPMPHDQCPMAVAVKERRAVRNVEAIAERPDGVRVPFAPYPTPLFDDAGTFVGAVNMLLDLTERNRSDLAAHRLAAIVESSQDAIVAKDLEGVISSWNRGAERLFGYTAEEAIGRPIAMLIPGDRLDEEPDILARIQRGEKIDPYETVRRRKDGSLVEISLSISPIRDSGGRIVGASKIARDITELRRATEQKTLLLNEMKHRVKNTLATVQAIAQQTLRSASSEDRAAFIARLQALAQAHDLLTLESWNRAALGQVVNRTLQVFQQEQRARVFIEGPGEVWLDANESLLMTLAMHELATNALKYGALSNASGTVRVSWEVLEGKSPARVRLTWRESGGPPVAPPDRKGFGSRLIERALKHDRGTANWEFAPTGVICTLEMRVLAEG